MIHKLMILLSVATLSIAAGTASAYAAKCPANATAASMSIWPAHSIPRNETRSGMHPCGKHIFCSGGSGSMPRSCSWH